MNSIGIATSDLNEFLEQIVFPKAMPAIGAEFFGPSRNHSDATAMKAFASELLQVLPVVSLPCLKHGARAHQVSYGVGVGALGFGAGGLPKDFAVSRRMRHPVKERAEVVRCFGEMVLWPAGAHPV